MAEAGNRGNLTHIKLYACSDLLRSWFLTMARKILACSSVYPTLRVRSASP